MKRKLSVKQLLQRNEELGAKLQRAGDLLWHLRRELYSAGLLSEEELARIERQDDPTARLDAYKELLVLCQKQKEFIAKLEPKIALLEKTLDSERKLMIENAKLMHVVKQVTERRRLALAKMKAATENKEVK